MSTDFYTTQLSDTLDGRLSPSAAAAQIGDGLLQQSDLSRELGSLWSDVVYAASHADDAAQARLADMLVALSQRPDATDPATGGPLLVHGMRVWRDMPTLGWEINSVWNSRQIAPASEPGLRAEDIATFARAVRLTALMTASPAAAFAVPYRLQILWTFRDLETRAADPAGDAFRSLDVTVAGVAAAVVGVLGDAPARWRDEYEAGPKLGAPGRGGPLWQGVHGFTEERWGLWRERLWDIAGREDVGEDIRRMAERAAREM